MLYIPNLIQDGATKDISLEQTMIRNLNVNDACVSVGVTRDEEEREEEYQ